MVLVGLTKSFDKLQSHFASPDQQTAPTDTFKHL